MNTYTNKDSCTYLIKAKCGAPGFYIDTSSGAPDNTIVGLHYVEYDYSEDNGVNIQSNEFPHINSHVSYIDD